MHIVYGDVMSENRSFENIRDDFFINPKTGDDLGAAEHISEGIQALVAGNYEDFSESQPGTIVATMAREMVVDFSKARRFDHKSVAQLHPSGNIPALMANSFSTLMNNNTIVEEVAPVEVPYERDVIAWMNKNIAGYDDDVSSGSLTSGGTTANITSQLLARMRIEDNGWDGRTPAIILANEMAHYSIKKAAAVLGPRGTIQVEKMPLQKNSLKVDIEQLNDRVAELRRSGAAILSIVGIAGETETGLVEDLKGLGEIADENEVYYHVDGAYGAPFVLSKKAHLFDGISQADTITCDPHKYLYVNYNTGALLVKDAAEHGRIGDINSDGNEYMHNKEGWNPGSLRLEGSMGGQGASSLYWTIKKIGAEGLGLLYDHAIDTTKVFSERIEESGVMRNVFLPELNTACVLPLNYSPHPNENLDKSPHDPHFNLVEARLGSVGIYLSTTKFPVLNPESQQMEDRRVFRFVSTNPHTSKRDVEDIADELCNSWTTLISKN